MSLRLDNQHSIDQVGYSIGKLWFHLRNLKKGFISDLPIDTRHRLSGDLTILIGYGRKIFDIFGSRKLAPSNFIKFNFNSPNPSLKDRHIIDGSDFKYSNSITENHLLDDDLILQFIAKSEFYTNRAVVEVWKQLIMTDQKSGSPCFKISGVYNGFQRPDKRNWLGFHDGVSNLKPRERPYVILINPRTLNREEMWLAHGTYIAFIKFDLNLAKWQNLERAEQEKIIGRDKLTGCPLVGIDTKGNPIKDSRCPIRGTSEVIDDGNDFFREHPPYQTKQGIKILDNTHIGSTHPIDKLPIWNKKSLRIYRQGFESLVHSNQPPGFIAGLNFVTFQNTPERFFRSLTYQSTVRNIDGRLSLPTLGDYTSVQSAGIFLVPPIIDDEPFPGARIFFSNKEIIRLPKSKIT